MEKIRPINTFRRLQGYKIKKEYKYAIVAYFIIQEDRGNTAGFLNVLAYAENKEKADQLAVSIIEDTGHNALYVCKTGMWQNMNDEINVDRTEFVPFNLEGKLEQGMYDEMKKRADERKRMQKIRATMKKEIEEEKDNTSMAHYIKNWYSAIESMNNIEKLEEQLNNSKRAYESSFGKIMEQEARQPEFKSKWFSVLMEQLKSREELSVIPCVIYGFSKILEKESIDKSVYEPES